MSEKKEIEVLARGVCVRNGKLLLCHSKGDANTFLPGGHVEFEEMAAKALCREIKEETGLDAEAVGFLGAVEHTFKQKGERHCEINLVFEIKIPGLSSDRNPASCEDHIEFLWVPISRLSKSALEPAVLRRLLPVWLRGAGDPERWASTYGR